MLCPSVRNYLKNVVFSDKLLVRNFHNSISCLGEVSFKLSDIGEGIREVVVKEWFVKEGDKVGQFDEICEVQSDKASVTITSRYDGVIKKLHYKIDDIALVGRALVDIETEDEGTSSDVKEETKINNDIAETSIKIQTKQNENQDEIICIPSVRRLAKEHKIDLSQVSGSGKHGRILKEDILKYLDVKSSPRIKPGDRIEPIKGFQKTMVKTMTDSLKIPHLVYSDEVKLTQLSLLKKNVKDSQNLKLSYMPFFIKAASNALQRFPVVNSTVDENCENINFRSGHNIGFAIDTKVGLAVPVIKNVEKLGIIEINEELQRLVKSGRDGSFSPEDLAGGTFTVSNVGSIGGTYMKPVIMPPQVAILAFGTSRILPRFDSSNNIVAEEIVNISAAADHRIIDGATMARFVEILKKQLESPYLLFLNV